VAAPVLAAEGEGGGGLPAAYVAQRLSPSPPNHSFLSHRHNQIDSFR
jgi:hypothetical protein